MTVTRTVTMLIVLAFGIGCANSVQAQNLHTVQPILLEASGVCCENPATAASQLVALPCGDGTYLPPRQRDPLRVVPAAARLQPLPGGQTRRGYEATTTTWTTPSDVGSRLSTTPLSTTGFSTDSLPGPTLLPASIALPLGDASMSTTPVNLFRPVTIAPAQPSVPDGYVVGKGLVGQPKLYKSGQPVRNFFRYITL